LIYGRPYDDLADRRSIISPHRTVVVGLGLDLEGCGLDLVSQVLVLALFDVKLLLTSVQYLCNNN